MNKQPITDQNLNLLKHIGSKVRRLMGQIQLDSMQKYVKKRDDTSRQYKCPEMGNFIFEYYNQWYVTERHLNVTVF